MAGLRVHPIRGALACLSLLSFLSVGDALAQPAPSAKGAPATLRLAQVVVRLPDPINLYAIAQDESGNPVALPALPPGGLSALIGPTYTKAKVSQGSEGIAIVFLIDISASLHPPQFKLIKDSVLRWIELLEPDRGPATIGDRAAIVTLGSSVKTVQDFTNDKVRLKNAVVDLEPRDQQTLLYQGLVRGIDLSRRLDPNKLPIRDPNRLPLRRAIVVLTDGVDDQKGGAGRQEVLDKLAVDPIPVYGLGASARNDAKVDAALKEFAGVVRASGGEYRPVDTSRPDAYTELRGIVNSTKHLTAECDPPCVPDGSAVVVRLFLSQDPVRLSSQSVTVRLVDLEGQVRPPPPQKPWWEKLLEVFANLSPQWWWIIPALIAGLSVAGVTIKLSFPDLFAHMVVLVGRGGKEQPENPEPPKVTSQEPDNSVVQIAPPLIVSSGTTDKQRLRLYPIGHNEIGPFDVLFEKTLAVGRSPESEICIPNDGQVSASHCALSPKGKFILVEDAGSRNGTRVNGVPINGFLHAEPNSTLGVGRTELRMKLLPVGVR